MLLVLCLVGFAGMVIATILNFLFYFKGKSIVPSYAILFACTAIFGVSTFLMVSGEKNSNVGVDSAVESQIIEQMDTGEAESSPVDKEDVRANFNSLLGGSSPLFYDSVRNDVTGKWRLLVCYTAENIVDHAADYYNAYFESDDEVHIVVNLGLNTTSVINCFSGYLFVDVHEYVDNEEHDANILGSGMLLKSYSISLSTGEIEDLSA